MRSEVNDDLEELARLLHQRNEIDERISRIIGRPALNSHIGEYLASKLFDITLGESATAKGIDGVFVSGPLKGKTVNVKTYGKREGLLDITSEHLADYYLVITGPKSQPISSRGTTRPFNVSGVYLFNMRKLVAELEARKVRIGVATSVAQKYWDSAEIYPRQNHKELKLGKEQIELINKFKRTSL